MDAVDEAICHEEKHFPNGDVYIGIIKGSLPHGEGKYNWSDGTIYEGMWEEGKMSGRGRICWISGATYEGDFSGGFLHGFGIFTGLDGSIYQGTWRMNIQHGSGKKEYSNSDNYDGSWKEGVKDGSGKYDWSIGNTYIGSWKAGRMCGRGVMKWENGDLFDGFWLDGLRHGAGFYMFADGSYYFGTWSKGLKDGHGIFYPAGSELPSLPNWYSSVGYYDNIPPVLPHASSSKSERFSVRKRKFYRSLSEKYFSSGFLRKSGRISNKPVALEKDSYIGPPVKEASSGQSSHTSSFASEESENKVQNVNNLVYLREYMQGILVEEQIRNNEPGLSSKKKQKNKSPGKKEKTKPGEIIFKGHRSYHLMLNLQLGIRYTVGKITPVPMREVRSSDFGPRARIRMYFPRKGSQNLREMFKIDAADYMMSICGGDGLRELSSPGKSGSIFYLSQDDRFFIKTLRRSELKVLLKMLPDYYNHVRNHDNTLITKFFGLHRMALKHGKKVRFVVMGNMLCTELRIHRRFDLKGSSHGRFTEKHEIDENTTLKDLDLSYVFHMNKSWRESLLKDVVHASLRDRDCSVVRGCAQAPWVLAGTRSSPIGSGWPDHGQISLDCMFLESQCIIDYSLLLGVHFRAPERLRVLLGPPDATENCLSLLNDDGTPTRVELLIPQMGMVLALHEPSSVSAVPGSHIRGGALRASSTGNEEVDLVLPGTGRLRVQLGVNMPAQANRILPLDEVETNMPTVDTFEVYDVVLYLGIIDILQDYNVKKKLEHAYKSLQYDSLSISAVEPKVYSERFIKFLEKVFPDQT
ncbi:hypothetical protein Syun_003128 [Stephania yunnanensis]|uniref:Phosphatidylinositol 4-phosphate 5-kinase n=1 Tax=Stephania yunnanensis TaxID=152371 RepID=A0AAP0L0W0_9MAGN